MKINGPEIADPRSLLVAELDQRLYAACVTDCIMLELYKPSEAELTGEVAFEPDKLSPTLSGDRVVQLAHALVQAEISDNPLDDELAWMDQAAAKYRIVERRAPWLSNPGRSLSYGEDKHPWRRLDWHATMSRQRTVDGQRVLSPFGTQFAVAVATGQIILPRSTR